MSTENSIEIESFDDYLKMLQTSEEEKTNNTRGSEKINKDSAMSEKKTVIRRKIKRPKRTENFQKSQIRDKKKKQKRIASISKQIEKKLFHKTRYTEPKKRNLLTRIILQHALDKGLYEDIEEDYDFISEKEIEMSKNAKKRSERRFYKEVQEYEDAKDDVRLRKGWKAFKIGLAASLLAGSLALAGHIGGEIKNTISNPTDNEVVTIETLDENDRAMYEANLEKFLEKVKEKDGYVFANLDDTELLDGYLRILNEEKGMTFNEFKNSLNVLKDQENLEKIVKDSFGEERYNSFSEEQKRDYRQLAYELLPLALPGLWEEGYSYVRNPISTDVVEAKNSAREKGYEIKLIVSSDYPERIKAVGNILYLENNLKLEDYQSINSIEESQKFLEEILTKSLGENSENISEKDLRDYKQIAYELLPEEVKENYVKDPIELERIQDDIEIGE
ncbi:MAG TPA: hypothetical protein IAD08_05665 [Candidatus Scatovivens faecipullorum]|nr:hypothetical protein [Candidatus Scatovivens faecipullorum]